MEKKKANKTVSKPKVLSSPDGKLPPQAIELEQAVLGALMIDNDAL